MASRMRLWLRLFKLRPIGRYRAKASPSAERRAVTSNGIEWTIGHGTQACTARGWKAPPLVLSRTGAGLVPHEARQDP